MPVAGRAASVQPAPLPGAVTLAALGVPPRAAVRPRDPVRVRQSAELIGLDSDALEAALGVPAMLRHDAPAEVWQYRSTACVLSVFLYAEGARWRVTYVDIGSPRGGSPVPAADCFASLSS